MGCVQSRWFVGCKVDSCVADNGCKLGSVEGRVGDNIGEKMVVGWCNLDGMGLWKEKEDIVVRGVGIGVGWMRDWCTEIFVRTGKNCVAGLLSGECQCRWVAKTWLLLRVGIVGEKQGVPTVKSVTFESWVVLVAEDFAMG
jgi:hypothetical protein